MKLECEVKVKNALGLHARPAAAIAKLLQNKKSQVYLTYRNETVNGRSIMGILVLAAQQGARIQLAIDGEDAQETMDMLVNAFDNAFEEVSG